MAYATRCGYLLCDDFARFRELLASGMAVVVFETRRKGEPVFRNVTLESFKCGTGLLKQRRKFRERGILFLDPATQYDPYRSKCVPRRIGCFSEFADAGLLASMNAKADFLEAASLFRRPSA